MRVPSVNRRTVRRILVSTVLAAGVMPAAAPIQAAPGDLDGAFAGFGVGGVLVTDQANSWGMQALAVHLDGKIVVAGTMGSGLMAMRRLPNGSVDPSFGVGGMATISVPDTGLFGTDVAVQDDGKIVVVGFAVSPRDFAVARFTETGVPDSSFGENGIVMTDFDGGSDSASAVVIQADGKIVVAGTADIDGDDDFAIARYHPDGTLDTSFAGDGKGSAGFGGDDQGRDVALDADGKIVVAGYTTSTIILDTDFAVARFNVDGSPDTSFGGGDGEVTTGFGGLGDAAHTLAIQSDGRIVVAGSSGDDIKVARYLHTGVLDKSFDGDGKLSIGGLDGEIEDVAVQPDGKIVLLGGKWAIEEDDSKMYFYRIMPNGTMDTTFHSDGRASFEFIDGEYGQEMVLLADGRILAIGHTATAWTLVRLWPDGSFDAGGHQALGFDDPGFPPGSAETAHAMVVQPDGKIVVAGTVSNAGRTETDAALARFLPNGQLDTAFGQYGRVAFGLGVHNGARAVALQPDGKIVVAGYVRTGSTVNFMIGRFNPDGTADSSCGLAGQNVIDFMGGVDYGWALALAPDGKIVVAGEASNGVRTVFGVARFNANCSIDTSFNGTGKQLIEHTVGAIHWATSVVVQPDLKIVVAGQVGTDFALMRLNPNGSVDSTFGSGGWTITNMGGPARISALLRVPTNGWYVAAGTRAIEGNNDFALVQYSPNGVLTPCGSRGEACGRWNTGKRYFDWTGDDVASAMAWRSDGVIAVAGCSGGHFAFVQVAPFFPEAAGPPPVVMGTTDIPGTGECAMGVGFAGANRVVLAGRQVLGGGGDSNFALARFETSLQPNVPTPTPTAIPSATPTRMPSATPSVTPSITPTPAASHTPSPSPSPSPSASPSPSPSPTERFTETPTPTGTGTTVLPTGTSTMPAENTPTGQPTLSPTLAPTLPADAGRIYMPQASR